MNEITDKLQQLRRKLIDISGRNPLIKYNLSTRQPRHIDIIDHTLDDLWIGIGIDDSENLQLRYLPSASTHEEELMSIEEIAKMHGFNPVLELPIESTKRNRCNNIWTLLQLDRFRKLVTRIYENARLASEEKGISSLHCVLGFLEWKEADCSDVLITSPLLLVPIQMENFKTTGEQKGVRIRGNQGEGTPPIVNPALKLKLIQDFRLTLPIWEESDTPSSFIAKVANIISIHRKWRVVPRIVISNFAFPRLALYEDLDETKWAHEHSNELVDHPLISLLLGGFEREPNNDHNEIVEDKIGKPIEGVVFSADSSQLEAIRRITSGESLVIEGPPGTGKSQTIANIITTAMARGKTVLFIADKKAAIDVVEQRLESAGLGSYCLNLHEGSAIVRSNIYNRIAERLDLFESSGYSHSKSIRDCQHSDELYELSEKLNEHFNKFSFECGSSITPARDIIWDSINCRFQYQNLHGSLRKVNISDPLSLTNRQKTEIIEQLELVEELSLSVDPENVGLRKHPLFGLNLTEVSFERREKLEDAFIEVKTPLSNLICQSNFFSHRGITANTISDLKVIITFSELYDPETDYALLNELFICSELETLQSLLKQFTISCPSSIHLELNKENMQKMQSFAKNLLEYFVNVSDYNIVDSEIRDCHFKIKKFNESLALFREIISTVCPILMTSETPDNWVKFFKEFSMLVKTVQEISPKVRFCLQPALRQSSRDYWTTLYQQVIEARNVEETLRHLPIKVEDIPATIERLSCVLLEPCLWHLISPSWWKARSELIQLVDPEIKLTHSERLVKLENFQRGQELIQKIRSDVNLKPLLDSSIDPYNADFSKIFEALELQDMFADKFSLWKILCEQSSISAEQFLQQIKLTLGEEASNILLSIATHIENKYPGLNFDTIVQESIKEEERFSQIELNFKALGLKSCISLHDLHLLSRTFEKLENLIVSNELLSLRTIKKITDSLRQYSEAINRLGEKPVKSFQQVMNGFNLHERNEMHIAISNMHKDLSNFKTAWNELIDCSSLDEIAFFGSEMTSISPITITSRIDAVCNEMHKLSGWARMQRVLDSLQSIECPARELVQTHIREGLSLKGIANVFKILLCQIQAKIVFSNHTFQRLDGDTLQRLRRGFVREDTVWLAANNTLVKRRLLSNQISKGVNYGLFKNYTDLALIRHELGKKTRRISERQLIARAHPALLALMPCFMMSPLMVAQYLSSSCGPKFDLVLIDEASQMRPEDAISAIARGKQLVVVGDSLQLPPTNFLASVVDDEDVSDEDSVDNESILDAAKVRFSTHNLKWHYRSRHDSLIHFSNQMFYGGRLIVCPSPLTKSSISGIHLTRVDGIYKNSSNQLEAEQVVQKAIEILKQYPDTSIGIVAMNREQSELISNLIYEIRCHDAEVDAAIEKWEECNVRCFVKNIENVQGDERDVILISTVYGPSELGASVMRRFGPINSAVGHRRLNVLFTRARNAMYVFSSLRPIDVCPPDIATPSRGIDALAKFLEFAGSGILAASSTTLNRKDPDSPFELFVGQLLECAGYEVEYQVGQSGFRIDIGVKHSSFQFGFIAGIECDGAPYHSSISARDRDKLRQEILEDHGWNIYRIWSTDWFNDPQNEGKKLIIWLQERQYAINNS